MQNKKVMIFVLALLITASITVCAQKMTIDVQSFLRFYTNVHWLQMPERILKTLDTNDWAEGLGIIYSVELQRYQALPNGYEQAYRREYLSNLWTSLASYVRSIGNSNEFRQNGYTGDMLVSSMTNGMKTNNFGRSQMASLLGIRNYDDARSYFTSIDFDTIRKAMNYHFVNTSWRCKAGDEIIFVYFMPNGSYYSEAYKGNRKTFSESGTYTVSGNRITIRYKDNKPNETIQYRKINRNVFSIPINGRPLEFHRPK